VQELMQIFHVRALLEVEAVALATHRALVMAIGPATW
jgi:DNA-binding GntR family transcriptional regulator